uniref:Ion_trans_2 domain-containing protein n=1 Tax=Haemonchus placei TaxID=6290 RepID=A0A0N4WEB4_HAEPC
LAPVLLLASALHPVIENSMSFIHGLFFSFNTITTIGLGNIYVKSHFYLAVSSIKYWSQFLQRSDD